MTGAQSCLVSQMDRFDLSLSSQILGCHVPRSDDNRSRFFSWWRFPFFIQAYETRWLSCTVYVRQAAASQEFHLKPFVMGGGISSEILLGQWHPAGATPHHAKPILCLWLEIRALHQVLLTSMQHGFQSRPPVKNDLDAVCTDVVRRLHTSDLGLQSCG